MSELSLVMPFYNEEDIVENVLLKCLAAAEKFNVDCEVLAVINGSKDRTGDIINSLAKQYPKIKPVLVKENLGYGFGITTGLSHAKSPVIGYVDGDGQVPLEDVFLQYQYMKSKDLAFCKAIRKYRGDGIVRLCASFGYNLLYRIVFGINVVDINAKPKLFKKSVYDEINLSSKDWFIDAEIILLLFHKGYKVDETFEVYFNDREEGKSNVRFSTVLEFVKNLLHWRLKLWNIKT
jgi:glycosyltransferase involved in cell wall biosynthesis